ncbi:MAG: tRNA guanosine(34) transglycosylase Tgt [Candidatus Zambryskibacteria bacterium]|nr:tRNA guanosine(34) transglycosylase Tgt [Candidatus Zambryskibacteria bacterium]
MFKIEKKISKSLARAGVLQTAHGEIKTPAFVAVGTKATVKSLTPEQIKDAGSQIVLTNTYHLYLEPGEKQIKRSGGLHKFMNWSGPMMTDSGGFQAFSLGVAYGSGINKFIGTLAPERDDLDEAYSENKEKKAQVTEDGVKFRSVIDGSLHFFTPEKSIQIQNDLGADIIFAFDECTSPHASKEYLREAMERTHRWAERCLEEFKNLTPNQQQLFGIVQGGRYEDLRKKSAKFITRLDFDGFGIGGSFVKEDMATAVKWVNEILPEEKSRHLLGVGEPIDLILGVENGCDTFDCVAPTRMARNGTLYTRKGKINILNAKFRNQMSPIETGCGCYTCQNYTVSYLAHLFRAKEMLAATLATIHNLYFLNNLMSQIREAILNDKFSEFKEEFLKNYKS